MVGVRGFEPPTSWTQTRRATRLRYTPISDATAYIRCGGVDPGGQLILEESCLATRIIPEFIDHLITRTTYQVVVGIEPILRNHPSISEAELNRLKKCRLVREHAIIGGPYRFRTDHPLLARQALYQMS